MSFAIKAEIPDPGLRHFSFPAQKTMYGGKAVKAGDVIYLFASETQGGVGLFAVGRVTQVQSLPKNPSLERQTPRISVEVEVTARLTGRLGRDELKVHKAGLSGDPLSELNFKFYRQATNKVVGLSEAAARYLGELF